MSDNPRITFGMIVLNGEPFTRYNLRSLYPYAHQIIVVEGACQSAKNIATPDGHSRDTTLEVLRRFQAEEDPENKVLVVTAEDEAHPDGFWSEKDEMSQAYAKRATGDYLWQVDSDEFYTESTMQQVIDMITADRSITEIDFTQFTFWGGFDYIADGSFLRHFDVRRVFAWGPGYKYAKHRPPTILTDQGADVHTIKLVTARTTADAGLRMMHYSLLLPQQVTEKCDYYSAVAWIDRKKAVEWAQDIFFGLQKPYRVHNVYEHPSWLERFTGDHPKQIEAMRADIERGILETPLRKTDDIDRLLASIGYRLGRFALRATEPAYNVIHPHAAKWAGRFRLVFCEPSKAWAKIKDRSARTEQHETRKR